VPLTSFICGERRGDPSFRVCAESAFWLNFPHSPPGCETHRVRAVGREIGEAVAKVLAARFIELHGELIDARAELRMAVRLCRSHFVASGPLEPAVAIAHLREIQRASDVVDRAAFALERYVLAHRK
jgi:hypothetical protein